MASWCLSFLFNFQCSFPFSYHTVMEWETVIFHIVSVWLTGMSERRCVVCDPKTWPCLWGWWGCLGIGEIRNIGDLQVWFQPTYILHLFENKTQTPEYRKPFLANFSGSTFIYWGIIAYLFYVRLCCRLWEYSGKQKVPVLRQVEGIGNKIMRK